MFTDPRERGREKGDGDGGVREGGKEGDRERCEKETLTGCLPFVP